MVSSRNAVAITPANLFAAANLLGMNIYAIAF